MSKLKVVSIEQLEPDPDVQILFTFKPKLVERIVKDFDANRLGVLDVVPNGEGWTVIDGRHRLAACKAIGHSQVRVDDHGTLDLKGKARLKLAKDQTRRTVSPLEHFLVELKAEVPEVLAITEIVKAKGFEIGKSTKQSENYRRIEAVAQLKRIYNYDEGKTLERVLELNRLWLDEPKSNGMHWLNGLASFVREGYADKLSAKQINVLSNVVPAKVIAQALAQAGAFSGSGGITTTSPLIAERLRKIIRHRRTSPL